MRRGGRRARGLIQNPARCAFDPDALVPSLLTEAQATAIKTVLAPVTDSSGRLIYPGSSGSAASERATQAPHPTAPQPWGAAPLAFSPAWPASWFLAYNVFSYLGLYERNRGKLPGGQAALAA